MHIYVIHLNVHFQTLNIKGLVPSVFTPFDDKGKINLDVIPQYAEYLHKNNVNGVLGVCYISITCN